VRPLAAPLEPAKAADQTESTMDLDNTARVRQPRDAVEYRLGTVTDITYAPHTTYIRRLRLRFPTGDERTYTTDEITPCTREEDHIALETAFIDACAALRNACRIAHDYDEALSTDIIGLLLALDGTARTRLNLTLNPARQPQHGDHTRDVNQPGGQP
jgi:hypothetical protein